MWRLAWKNMETRKIQTILTVVTVAIATGVFFASLLFAFGLENGLQEGMNRLGADILVLPEEAETDVEQTMFTGVPMNIYMDNEIEDSIRQVPGVQSVTAQFFSQTLDKDCCSLGEANRLVGIDLDTDFVLKPWLENQSKTTLGDNEIIIGGDIPAFLGGKASILNQPFNVAGQLQLTGASMDKTIFLPIAVARKLAAESEEFQYLWQEKKPHEVISAVLIKTDPQVDVNLVAKEIGKIKGVKVVVASQVVRQTKGQLQLLEAVLLFLGLALWVVSLLAMASRFMTIILERKTEVGVFRSLGASQQDIFTLVVSESVLTTFLGGIIGVSLGLWLAVKGVIYLKTASSYPFLMPDFGSIGVMALICLGVAALAGIMASSFPAYRCAKLDPASAIVQGELE